MRITGPAVEGRLMKGYDGLRVRVQLVQVDAARGFIGFTAVKQ